MWPRDPDLRSAALELYGSVWEHVPAGIEQARLWGGDWFEVSTPFLIRSGSRILAHAGMITCDLKIDGRRTPIVALHGVCVHPDHQGRGLGRQVLEQALEHIDASGAATTILWSEKIELYRRFGFEAAPESLFVAELPGEARDVPPCGAPRETFRVDLENPRHLDLLLRALEKRESVSHIAAAADTGWHFLIDLALWTEARNFLVALPDDEAIVVCEAEGDTLRLYDIVGPNMPPLSALIDAGRSLSDTPPRRLEIYFTPDLLRIPTQRAPHPVEDVLMVRGEPLFESYETPFAFSLFTRT